MTSQSACLLSISLALLAGGCADLPRDQHGAAERIRQSGILTVGISPSEPQLSALEERERLLVEKIARRLHARVVWRSGNAHQLLQDLEELKLPLAAVSLPCDSPFGARLGLSQPYLKDGPQQRDYCLAVAPGENHLLLVVDQVIAQEQQEKPQ